MGSGRWDATTYTNTTGSKIASGTTFAHSATMHSTAPHLRAAHATLDPTAVAGATSPLAGKHVRESRDNDEHPTSIPVAVIFDVTGSMGVIPKKFVEKLKDLFSLVLRKGYIEHPQVLIGANGDVTCDSVPLQMGQFESDNRVDDTLDNVFLEGGGGGGDHESYDLAFYFIANHTVTDAWEKRGKKGYAFFIGDEKSYTSLESSTIEKYIGEKVQGPIELKDIVASLRDKWEAFFIVPTQGNYDAATQAAWWRQYFGDNVLVLQDMEDVAELIAITIGTNEGVIDLEEGLEDLKEIGSTAGGSVGKALEKRGGGGSVAVAEAPTDLDTTEDDDTERV